MHYYAFYTPADRPSHDAGGGAGGGADHLRRDGRRNEITAMKAARHQHLPRRRCPRWPWALLVGPGMFAPGGVRAAPHEQGGRAATSTSSRAGPPQSSSQHASSAGSWAATAASTTTTTCRARGRAGADLALRPLDLRRRRRALGAARPSSTRRARSGTASATTWSAAGGARFLPQPALPRVRRRRARARSSRPATSGRRSATPTRCASASCGAHIASLETLGLDVTPLRCSSTASSRSRSCAS